MTGVQTCALPISQTKWGEPPTSLTQDSLPPATDQVTTDSDDSTKVTANMDDNAPNITHIGQIYAFHVDAGGEVDISNPDTTKSILHPSMEVKEEEDEDEGEEEQEDEDEGEEEQEDEDEGEEEQEEEQEDEDEDEEEQEEEDEEEEDDELKCTTCGYWFWTMEQRLSHSCGQTPEQRLSHSCGQTPSLTELR